MSVDVPVPAAAAAAAAAPARSAHRGDTRLDWVDAAKGLAIVLVVLFHSTRVLHQAGIAGEEWLEANRYLALLRMPVFFALSGLFLGSVVRRSWRALWAQRLSVLAWAFVVWVVLRFAWFTAVPLSSRPSESDLARLVVAPLAPGNGLWFLHALLVFTVLARATRRVPVVVQLGGAAVVSGAVFCVCATPETYGERLGAYYVFFVGAGLLAPVVRRLAAQATALRALGLAAVFGAGSYVVVARDVQQLLLPLGVLAIALGVTGVALLPARATRALGWLGARTLPVYVGHFIVIGACCEQLLRAGTTTLPAAHAGVLLLALSAVAIAVSLVVWSIARRTPLRALYAPPRWVRTTP